MLPKVVGILQSAETGTCHLGAFDQQCSNRPWGHEGRILPEWKFTGRFETKHQTFAQSTPNWQACACPAKGASAWTQLTIWSSSQVMLDPGFSKIMNPPPRLIADKMKRDLAWISDDSCTASCWAMELDGTPSKNFGGPGRLRVALECLQQNGAATPAPMSPDSANAITSENLSSSKRSWPWMMSMGSNMSTKCCLQAVLTGASAPESRHVRP